MRNLWTRGGLPWRELLARTWHETWEDAVFGQAARLGFYHFLAIFPSLLLLFFLLAKLAATGSALRSTLSSALGGILPSQAAVLMTSVIQRLNATAMAGAGALSAGLGAVWAAVNGTWAMMTGLNTAYEVKEERPLWKVVGIAFLLTISLAVLFLIALFITMYGTRAAQAVGAKWGASAPIVLLLRGVQWPVLIVLLLVAFALYYRFGPNLYDREWQWSTPGALLALLLWLLATLLLHLYFEWFHSYHVVYGSLEGVAILLMWLYFTSAAILIGGELNSEIEKAAEPKSSSGKAPHAREGN